MKFFVNGVEIGSGTINAAGVASFTTGSLAVGSYTVTASYAGDAISTPATERLPADRR